MKRILALAMAISSLLISSLVLAEDVEKSDIALELPPDFYAQVCAAPVWNGVTVAWKGIVDSRADKAVGMQTKKGKEPIEVTANPPLEREFDKAIRELFTRCGMKVAGPSDGAQLKLSAQIKAFYVGVEKKIVTGQSKAKSMLTFVIDKGLQSTMVDTGMEMESKDVRKGDIKALTKALNKLFAETLRQIPTTEQLRDLK